MVYGFVKTHHRGTRQTPAILIMCGNNAIERKAAGKEAESKRFFLEKMQMGIKSVNSRNIYD